MKTHSPTPLYCPPGRQGDLRSAAQRGDAKTVLKALDEGVGVDVLNEVSRALSMRATII